MLADCLKQLRKSIDLTQEEISKKLNISRGTYAHYEIGKREPNYETLTQIANFFNVSIDYLLGNTNSRNLQVSPSLSNGAGYSTIDASNNPINELSSKEKRDIAKDLDNFKEELLGSDSLMFDGEPLSDESVQSILSALEIGMQMVRQKNKAKYTPKKYRK